MLVICWDPKRPEHPAPPIADIRATMDTVKEYFLEVSNGYFTIDVVDVLGWYPAVKPPEYYWSGKDEGDQNNDGWIDPHKEKWAEAIRKASADFNFEKYNTHPDDDKLSTDELGLLIVIPQKGPFGTNRIAVGSESPKTPLIVDNVKVGWITEAYLGGSDLNFEVVAHELSHYFLGLGDMYTNFDPFPDKSEPYDNPFRAGRYSLMDDSYNSVHIGPLSKMKLGWLKPQLILRSGRYSLPSVAASQTAWILLDPNHGTDEYFIVENRFPGNSFDKEILDSRMAVWHIIEKKNIPIPPTSPNWPTEAWEKSWDRFPGFARRGIRLIRPVWNELNPYKSVWDGSEPDTGYDLKSEDSNPLHATLKWADGSPSGFSILDISGAGKTMTAYIKIPIAGYNKGKYALEKSVLPQKADVG